MSQRAHSKDVETQRKYGVEHCKYWVNETGSKVFCLAHAPNAEAAACVIVRRTALSPRRLSRYGWPTSPSIPWRRRNKRSGSSPHPGGAADERDPGIRTILFTDIVDSTALTQSVGDEAAGIVRPAQRCCPERAGRSGRSRDQAHWRRHYGVICVGGSSSEVCSPDSTRAG